MLTVLWSEFGGWIMAAGAALVAGVFTSGYFGINVDPMDLMNHFRVNAANGDLRAFIHDGMQMAGATGGDKGVGTINATAVYDDNSLLTCYPIEAFNSGRIDLAAWDAVAVEGRHEPARRFAEQRMQFLDLDTFTRYWREHGHLPTLPSRDEWRDHARDKQSTGQLVQALWETVDLFAVHIHQLKEQLNAAR